MGKKIQDEEAAMIKKAKISKNTKKPLQQQQPKTSSIPMTTATSTEAKVVSTQIDSIPMPLPVAISSVAVVPVAAAVESVTEIPVEPPAIANPTIAKNTPSSDMIIPLASSADVIIPLGGTPGESKAVSSPPSTPLKILTYSQSISDDDKDDSSPGSLEDIKEKDQEQEFEMIEALKEAANGMINRNFKPLRVPRNNPTAQNQVKFLLIYV